VLEEDGEEGEIDEKQRKGWERKSKRIRRRKAEVYERGRNTKTKKKLLKK
jgi:hypothetical protein